AVAAVAGGDTVLHASHAAAIHQQRAAEAGHAVAFEPGAVDLDLAAAVADRQRTAGAGLVVEEGDAGQVVHATRSLALGQQVTAVAGKHRAAQRAGIVVDERGAVDANTAGQPHVDAATQSAGAVVGDHRARVAG